MDRFAAFYPIFHCQWAKVPNPVSLKTLTRLRETQIIPPYFPDPIEVTGNVSSQPYDVRLNFVRKLSAGAFASMGFAFAVAVSLRGMPWQISGVCLLAAMLLLTVCRYAFAGGKREVIAAAALTAPVLISAGLFFGAMYELGAPVWVLVLVPTGSALYAFVSGRDFSFVGQYGLSLSFTILCGLVGREFFPALFPSLGWGIALAFIVQLFYTYDMAMILKRRRLPELPCAITDFYCDSLNFITYSMRVKRHWRRFRAASPPPEEEPS